MSLIDTVRATFPAAEQLNDQGPTAETALIRWADAVLVVTPSEDHAGGYLLGIYTGQSWIDLDEALAYLEIPDAARVVAILDYLTEYEPEEVSFPDWAAQRIADEGLEMDRPG